MRFGLGRAALAGATAALTTAGVIVAVPAVAHAGPSPHPSVWSSRLSTAQVGALAANANQRVIVLLRDQHSALAGPRFAAQRAAAFATDRAPIVAQLQQLHASRVVTYSTLNAVSTTISKAEVANLKHDPAVLAVDPDVVIHGPSSNANLLTGAGAAAPASTTTGKALPNPALCGTATAPLLEPQALHLINADNRTNADSPYTSGPLSAHSLGYTGAGVNIAVFPDGMDPTLPDFQRNGHSAVTDYEDFTGEGTSAPTPGGEAFGDVSSLVAQAHTTYNLQQEINPAFAGKGACDVKVLGVAPGATVDEMKVFGETNLAFTSEILQGIDWAINHDHANILSISIGFFAVPTSAAEQPLTQILENAIKNGTVVVASTGDASPSNTEESPALDANVIGAAASTGFRLYAQTNGWLYDMAQAIHQHSSSPSYTLGQATPGWLNDQVSTLSSSGVTESGRMPDIIAPGDSDWAVCSTDTATYSECGNSFGGSTIGLEDFGGTSQSTPFTSGVAALVIQAYRLGHGGKTPTPAVVRQIIFSSATDIGIQADEQGAGLLNALRAVQLAKAYGSTSSTGGLLHSPSAISDLGKVNSAVGHVVTVTNSGSTAATISPVLRTLGPARTLSKGSISLFEAGAAGFQETCGGIDSVKYYTGETIPEVACKSFNVPAGVDEFDSRIGWNPLEPCSGCTAGEPTAREILIDPAGRYAQYSDPQGDGAGFADEQVHQPLPGTWTLLVFGRKTSNYEGPVSFLETAQTFHDVSGAVSPASRVVAPGQSASFTVTVHAPASPGFFTGAIVFHSNRQAALGTIPVSSEAEVPVTTTSPGHFTGTLIGGNGRGTFFAQELSYQLVVPKGVHDLDVNMTSADDGYFLMGQLVNPFGSAVDSQLSFQQVSPNGDNANTHAVELVWANPVPGVWRVNVTNGQVFLPGLDVYSGLTQSTLNGTVSFNTDKVSVTGLPSGTLTPGTTVTAHVHVTNTGPEPESYQVDPRTGSQVRYVAQSVNGVTSGTLPVTGGTPVPQYAVPPFSSGLNLSTSTTGSTPITFDVSSFWGAPDVMAAPSTAGTTSISLQNPIASEWGLTPDEIGPFGSGPAKSEDYSTGGTVDTSGFDGTAVPDTGDIWEAIFTGGGGSLNPLYLQPGQSGTINVTFTVPKGTTGSKVAGELAVETFNFNALTTGIADWSSDVLGILPYSYKLGS